MGWSNTGTNQKERKCARGGGRTRTGISPQGILSPLCLPFHHPGRNELYDGTGVGGEKRRGAGGVVLGFRKKAGEAAIQRSLGRPSCGAEAFD